MGGVRRVKQDLSFVAGTYSLMQSPDGTAMLRMTIGGAEEELFTFQIASPDGGFVLCAADGGRQTYLPLT